MLSKKNIVLIVIVIIIVAGIALLINNKSKDNAYSVVYLTTGEVYVGKLTNVPDLQLTDAYVLQVTKDDKDSTKSNFQLQPIKEALWAPQSIHFIKDNVVFYGSLLPTSKIAEAITAQTK